MLLSRNTGEIKTEVFVVVRGRRERRENEEK